MKMRMFRSKNSRLILVLIAAVSMGMVSRHFIPNPIYFLLMLPLFIPVAWLMAKFVQHATDFTKRRIEEFSTGFVEGWQGDNLSLEENNHRTGDVRLKEWP